MQIIQFEQFGDPSRLHLADRPQPTADSENAVVRVEAASINPSDGKNVAVKMAQTTLPRVPGCDYSGVVVDGPADWLGQEVWGTVGDVGFTRDGTHADFVIVAQSHLVRKPANLSHEEAGSGGVTLVTAWCALVEFAALGKDETVAIIVSKGRVGGAALQIANPVGAYVIGINRPRAAVDGQPIGLAEGQLDSADPNLASALRCLNGGFGANVVFNAAGGSMFEVGLGLLALHGRQVEISSPPERRVSFDLADFYHNESQLFGVDTLKRSLTASARILMQLTQGFEDGSYRPPAIAKVTPLTAAGQAYELVGQGARGRVVLKPSR